MNNEHVHGPDCNHDHEEYTTEELVQVTEDKVDALINVLIQKKIISEDELSSALDDLYEEDGDDE